MATLSSPLSLKRTELDDVSLGSVSLSHALKLFSFHSPDEPAPDGNALRSLRGKGIRLLSDMGEWRVQPPGNWAIQSKSRPSTSSWSLAAIKSWDKMSIVIRSLEVEWFSPGQPDLILPREHRRSEAERSIRQLAHISNLRPSLTAALLPSQTWGSDGSMTPASAGILDSKSVTAAITGPKTLVLKINGRNVSILQGELIGLIMGLVLSNPNDPDATLYTDHLNSVRLIDDSRTIVDQQHRLRFMNGRSYYRWILALVSTNPLKIIYTRGHSTEQSVPSRINFEADHYASRSQRVLQDVFPAPVPTFTMDDFTFHSHIDGWIESSIRYYVDKSAARSSSQRLADSHHQRMALHLYDSKAPPEYSYTHAYSAYSAVVQLYARSGQLPTAQVLHARGKLATPRCRMGCAADEDMHHVFVQCPRYAEWRTKATDALLQRADAKLDEKNIEEVDRVHLLAAVKLLFSDNNFWPLHYSTYYLGHIPRFDHLMPTHRDEDSVSHSRLAHHFASEWHTACIRLAGRIWGDWQREMSKKTDTRSRRNVEPNRTS
ncbi:hypothetical protein MVEN_00567000 [Mycena venus]|uniref:Uncharacterized protein n=1 Tax=Mycena venus TaxID=2733690 RepID=A0A8H6YJ77_9AGAR|nr:hypothetical protein MVEN_00567000 [Mycena venus]